MKWTVDFETTTDPNDIRVWAWGAMALDTEYFWYHNTIDSFFKFILDKPGDTFYFHNLKFDGNFCLWWLFKNNWEYVDTFPKENQFTVTISDKGAWYNITIHHKKGNIHINDSLKLITSSIKKIAHDFKLDRLKGEIDYNKYRPVGYKLNKTEVGYLYNDVYIACKALKVFFSISGDKLTIGSNALAFYKKQFGKKKFERHFPILKHEIDADIRQSYKGAWCYAKKDIRSKDMSEGLIFDVNSLYPYHMAYSPLPFGEPVFFEGEYKPDKVYPLYVQLIRTKFKLKKGYLPTIQLKGNLSFVPTEYIEQTGKEDVVICLTNMDLEIFKQHYDCDIEYLSGWKFQSSTTLFYDYIMYWVDKKIKAEQEGNMAIRTVCKLHLNSLYGKFGKNPQVGHKIPYFENEIVKYRQSKKEMVNGVYIPTASFIIAWGRYTTINAAQKLYDRFMYADTDSLHISGLEIPDIDIDQYELGKWKCEGVFKRARYLRAKCYIEDIYDGEFHEVIDRLNKGDKEIESCLKVTCAGLPKDAIPDVNWDNFNKGFITGKNLKQYVVRGGAYLKQSTFEIKA